MSEHDDRTPILVEPGDFDHRGHRIAYTSYGTGPQAVILIHGLLLSQKMHLPIATAIARRGYRAITIDVLGHGVSDRPRDMSVYSMTQFGEQVIALLDHLGLEDALLAGTSLGANISLEAALAAPDRVRGMVIEMPVLDNALLGCAIAFTPAMAALTFAQGPLRLLGAALKLLPTRRLWLIDFPLDVLRQDPAPSAAVMNGLFFGRVAPHRDLRRTIQAPALVIGHELDPIHPFSDALALAEELPNGRFVRADSIVELRVKPQRLTTTICDFIDETWASQPPKAQVEAKPPPKRRRRAA